MSQTAQSALTEQRHDNLKAGFFIGCGGLDLGFEHAGFETVYAMDYNQSAVDSYNVNRKLGDKAAVQMDITELNPDDVPDANVFVGGPPCTAWSTAGKMEGFEDAQGRVAASYAELIAAKRPDAFIFENTAALLFPKYEGALNYIKQVFTNAGYNLHTKVLDAADYGVPQRRRRLFIVGTRTEHDFHWPEPTHGEGKIPHRVLGDVIDEKHHIGRIIDEDELNERRETYFASRAATGKAPFGGSYQILEQDQLFPTVTRNFHQPSCGRFTIRLSDGRLGTLNEAGALMMQSFPARWRLRGNETDRRLMIANAVPPTLALTLAHAMRQHLLQNQIYAVAQ